MDKFKVYTQSDVLSLVNERIGEQKLGQRVQVAHSIDELEKSTAKFVILGIPEDIGVRANHGIAGAKTAWKAALKVFLNIQSNTFLSGEEVLILGHFEIAEPPVNASIEELRNAVTAIDQLVYPIIQKIILAKKTPIIIGGGHNNAAPIIWGTSLACNQKINVVNIDAHTDLRDTSEGRHSGNCFSYALEQGFLGNYRIFGLHQNYMNKKLSMQLQSNSDLKAICFEEILQEDKSTIAHWFEMVADLPYPCGLEIDLDSISNVLSSAATPSGFTINEIRKILLSGSKKFCYLHICEGAIECSDGRKDPITGKTIAYLISDFIKALLPRIYPQL